MGANKLKSISQTIAIIFLGIAVWCSAALPSWAQSGPISQADLDFFLEESYAGDDEPEEDKDWEDYLYEAIQAGQSPDASIKLFSSRIGADEDTARLYVDAIIEITRFDEHCPNRRGDTNYDCRFEKDAPAYDKFIVANDLEPSGELAFVIGKNVGSEYDPFEWRMPYLEVVVNHPGRVLTFRRMLDYTRDDIWVFALAAVGKIDTEAAKLIFLRYSSGSMSYAAGWNGSAMALIEMLLQRGGLDAESETFLSFALVSLQLRTGMNDVAVSTFRKLPRGVREFVPAPDGPEVKYENDRVFENYVDFKIDLAAAFYDRRRKRYASRLAGEAASISNEFENTAYGVRARAAVLNEILSPQLGRNEIYDYFVYGRLPDEPEIVDESISLGGGPGWLFKVGRGAPAIRTIAADYLRERDYDGMATYLEKRELYYRYDHADGLIDTLLPLLPEDYPERKEYWKKRIDEVWRAHEASKEKAASLRLTATNPPITPPRAYTEIALPETLRTAESDENFEMRFDAKVPEGVELPVSEFQLVRYEEENGERQIVFLSSALDAPGEIPAYGYWFQQTRRSGSEWEEPLYLGLQQYFPYVVVARSKLSLLSATGINIEVEAREIDPESISFPPVGLSLKREERHLYLSFDFKAISQDRDNDRLTDLVEYRLQMNAEAADTDGDGLEDGRDPLPLTAYDPQASLAKKELAYAILSAIVGYERGAIVVSPQSSGEEGDLLSMLAGQGPPRISDGAVFLKADPDLFAGVRTPFRLFVFSEKDVERINAYGAPFYPAEVSAVFSRPDGSEYYVIWSASWTGGEFIVRCNFGKCETEVTSNWIT